jgi:predicted dehydrogenase
MSNGDLRTFLACPEVDCVVACDVDEARFPKIFEITESLRGGKRPETVRDFRRVIERNDIDVILNVTPDHWHAIPTIMACQAGKDVYCEKPLATSIGESRAMVNAVRKHNRVLQMGTQWHSGEHWTEAVHFVQSGKLGRIRQVRAWAYLDWLGGVGNPADCDPPRTVDYDFWLGPSPKRPFNPNRFHFNFRWFWDYAGGLMTDWGVHLINIAMWAMGPTPPKNVTSSGGKWALDDNSETPDTQVALYEFPTYNFIWEHQIMGGVGIGGRPHGICFSGADATLIVDQKGWEVIPEAKKNVPVVSYKAAPKDTSRLAHVRNFLDCCRSRKDPIENVDVGHFVTSVALLGNVALRSGGRIEWDPKTETAKGNDKANSLIHKEYRAPWKLA